MGAKHGAQTVLLIGSGGREHAIALKLAASPLLKKLILVPGNDGMHLDWERWNLGIATRADFEKIAERALTAQVDLVVVGPDNPLADGIVDVLAARGLRCFGPDSRAAQIEASKSFAKSVMMSAGVPTAYYNVFANAKEALQAVEKYDWSAHGWVLKADGLAYGKGVFVCETITQAREALAVLGGKQKIIIEERLRGEELSWFAICDGESCALMDPARDYKRVHDYNEGPNTGGMGAISPVPGVGAELRERVRREVFEPTLAEMKKRGVPFRGLLYAGLMVDLKREKLWVIEFNCRFGDPETQVVLPRMKDDLLMWFNAAVDGGLSELPQDVGFSSDAAAIVIGAARGYPEKPEKGQVIEGETRGLIFAGVAKGASGKLVSSGGRVFGALGRAPSVGAAAINAYSQLEKVRFEGMHYRRDIGDPKVPMVVLASGVGSGFEALAQAIEHGELNAEILALISDKKDAPVIQKARALGIPALTLPYVKGDEQLVAEIQRLGARFVVLSGYMRIVSRHLIESFRSERGYSRVVNIHPALLPSFPGLNSYQQAYEYGVKVTGATVHLVEEVVDNGPICAQDSFDIEGRSLEDIEAQGKARERKLYRNALRWILPEKFALEKRDPKNEGRFCVRPY